MEQLMQLHFERKFKKHGTSPNINVFFVLVTSTKQRVGQQLWDVTQKNCVGFAFHQRPYMVIQCVMGTRCRQTALIIKQEKWHFGTSLTENVRSFSCVTQWHRNSNEKSPKCGKQSVVYCIPTQYKSHHHFQICSTYVKMLKAYCLREYMETLVTTNVMNWEEYTEASGKNGKKKKKTIYSSSHFMQYQTYCMLTITHKVVNP